MHILSRTILLCLAVTFSYFSASSNAQAEKPARNGWTGIEEPIKLRFTHTSVTRKGEDLVNGGKTEATVVVSPIKSDDTGSELRVRIQEISLPAMMKDVDVSAFEFLVTISTSGSLRNVTVVPDTLQPIDGTGAMRSGLIQQVVLTCFMDFPSQKPMIGVPWLSKLPSANVFTGEAAPVLSRAMPEGTIEWTVARWSDKGNDVATIVGMAEIGGRNCRVVVELDYRNGLPNFVTRSLSSMDAKTKATKLVNVFQIERLPK